MQTRNRLALFFSFFFPILFIVVFGFLNTQTTPSEFKLGVIPSESVAYSDLKTPLKADNILKVEENKSKAELIEKLEKNKIDGILEFGDNEITLTTHPNRNNKNKFLQKSVEDVINQQTIINNQITEDFKLLEEQVTIKDVKYLDFILPGILAFTILSRGTADTSFSFAALRKKGSLKQIFATPVQKNAFLLGQTASKIIFTFLQILLLYFIAYYLFETSPAKDWIGFWQMLPILLLGLLVFLALGHVIAGSVKKEESINILNTILIYPQVLLAGTFFSIEYFPTWLQKISEFLPLYNLNEALRLIFIDGLTLLDSEVLTQIGSLSVWAILIYFAAVKVFKFRPE